jgi:flagellar basal-body rod protein FlgC
VDLTDSLAISVSALDAQRHRLNVIASNLANAQSTSTPEGGPYRRRQVIFAPVSLAPAGGAGGKGLGGLTGVTVRQVTEDPRPGKAVHDPTHPDADKEGFVQMPNVNVMEEMVDLMAAHRAYEANVQAITAARSMWLRALEIGR